MSSRSVSRKPCTVAAVRIHIAVDHLPARQRCCRRAAAAAAARLPPKEVRVHLGVERFAWEEQLDWDVHLDRRCKVPRVLVEGDQRAQGGVRVRGTERGLIELLNFANRIPQYVLKFPRHETLLTNGNPVDNDAVRKHSSPID